MLSILALIPRYSVNIPKRRLAGTGHLHNREHIGESKASDAPVRL